MGGAMKEEDEDEEEEEEEDEEEHAANIEKTPKKPTRKEISASGRSLYLVREVWSH